ncbi:MAG: ribonuclease Z [Bacteroidetes bacterium]|nr:ribonuclease Z [Bacteroidota bacterium]
MDSYLVPLGVSAAVPFGGRHLSGLALRLEHDLLLFDCGEATQFRLRAAGVRTGPLKAIFVTHLHGDHYYGILGLLATLSLVGRTDPLTVVGPEGLAKFVDATPAMESRQRPFEIEFVELPPTFSSGVVFKGDSYTVRAARLDHTIFAVGYRVDEAGSPGHLNVELARKLGVVDPVQYGRLKSGEAVVGMLGRVESGEVLGPPLRGPSFAYVTDTRPCAGGVQLARDVDLLYHESTFLDKDAERAVVTGHSTAREAAEVAKEAGAGELLLSHFSARYREGDAFEDEARTVFPACRAAVELQRYDVAASRNRITNANGI